LQTKIETFLLGLTIFPWDSEAAQSYGSLRVALEEQGQLLGSLDLMIAAHRVMRRLGTFNT
jgi:tRNA(fMet)-specific endonuclease VapC